MELQEDSTNTSDYSNFQVIDKNAGKLAAIISKSPSKEIVDELKKLNENVGQVLNNSHEKTDMLSKISSKAEKVNTIGDSVGKLADLGTKAVLLWPTLKPFIRPIIKSIIRMFK